MVLGLKFQPWCVENVNSVNGVEKVAHGRERVNHNRTPTLKLTLTIALTLTLTIWKSNTAKSRSNFKLTVQLNKTIVELTSTVDKAESLILSTQ